MVTVVKKKKKQFRNCDEIRIQKKPIDIPPSEQADFLAAKEKKKTEREKLVKLARGRDPCSVDICRGKKWARKREEEEEEEEVSHRKGRTSNKVIL